MPGEGRAPSSHPHLPPDSRSWLTYRIGRPGPHHMGRGSHHVTKSASPASCHASIPAEAAAGARSPIEPSRTTRSTPIGQSCACHHAIMPPSCPHHGPITSTRSRPKRRRDHAHAMHTDTRRTPARLTPTSSTWRASPRAPQDWTAQGLRAQGLRPRGWTAPTAARASIASRPLERTRWLCGEGAGIRRRRRAASIAA